MNDETWNLVTGELADYDKLDRALRKRGFSAAADVPAGERLAIAAEVMGDRAFNMAVDFGGSPKLDAGRIYANWNKRKAADSAHGFDKAADRGGTPTWPEVERQAYRNWNRRKTDNRFPKAADPAPAQQRGQDDESGPQTS